MLSRNRGKLTTYAYLVAVELEEGGPIAPARAAEKLKEGLWWSEGVGQIDVDELGKIEVVDEAEEKDHIAVRQDQQREDSPDRPTS